MSVINTNVNAIIAQNAGVKNTRMQTQAMQQLSTGSRINSAADDAAGLAISSKMTSQIRGLNQAVRNANDGISLIQTAEGALTEVTNMLQRMRELAVQSASDTNTSSDRTALDAEFSALRDEINRIGNNTQFNGMNVLDKSFATGTGVFTFQVGANGAQTITIGMDDFRTTGGTTSSIATSSSTPAVQQKNTLSFATTATLAANATITITMTNGPDGTAQAYTYTNNSTAALASGTAIAAAIQGDGSFADLLHLTPTVANNVVTFTGDAGASYSLAATAGTVGAASYTASVQTDTLTFSGTYAAGDVITVDTGSGTNYSYTLASGDGVDATAITAAEVVTALAADIAGTDPSTDLGVASSTAAGTTLTLVGNSNSSFTTTATVNNSTGGDLSMINSSTIATRSDSDAAVTAVDSAIAVVSGGRATMGATINRLNYAADNLLATSANVSAARSRVQDTDYSQATTELARTQIIQQASTAMLAQANQSAQSVLSLLK